MASTDEGPTETQETVRMTMFCCQKMDNFNFDGYRRCAGYCFRQPGSGISASRCRSASFDSVMDVMTSPCIWMGASLALRYKGVVTASGTRPKGYFLCLAIIHVP